MHPLALRLKAQLAENPQQSATEMARFEARSPAGQTAVTNAEAVFGHQLPPLLHEIYRDLANGGFGPGYGVMGVEGGFTDDQGNTIVSLYQKYIEPNPYDQDWKWDTSWVPICHWGCGIYSVVKCVAPYPVYFVDADNKEEGMPMRSIYNMHKASLDEWMADWLDGRNLWDDFGTDISPD